MKLLKISSIVLFSLIMSAALLLIERMVGIGWDFHPDSYTYATTSEIVFNSISDDWVGLFNNGYYVVSYYLFQSIFLITLMNMILFSISNGLIYKYLIQNSLFNFNKILFLLLFLNPYRLHLSTTMLKDTMIIFFLILIITSGFTTRIFSFISLLALRVASPIYLLVFITNRNLFLLGIIFLFFFTISPDIILAKISDFNELEMKLRDFDRIPTFQDFGLIGSILRGLVWSFLAFTGLFAILSPAPAFVPVAVGSIMTLIFLKKVTGTFRIPLKLFVATSIFGVMVTGYTSYIRYIYPILVVWPLVVLCDND